MRRFCGNDCILLKISKETSSRFFEVLGPVRIFPKLNIDFIKLELDPILL